MSFQRLLLSTFIALSPWMLHALNIPLTNSEGGPGGQKIAFIDLDRIFQIYPQTREAKEDYMKQLEKKKEQLKAKEAELADITKKLSAASSSPETLSGTPPPAASDASLPSSADPSTTPTPAAGSSIEPSLMKIEWEAKKAEYEDLRRQAAKDLEVFESQQSQIILGKIYKALRELASEEQVTVIVDKASILYGETALDLTEKLQERVRGY